MIWVDLWSSLYFYLLKCSKVVLSCHYKLVDYIHNLIVLKTDLTFTNNDIKVDIDNLMYYLFMGKCVN